MLKRRPKDKTGGLGGSSGSEKGRPVVGRVGAEGNMLPFVVVGVEEEREEETRAAADESAQAQKGAGRIVVQPRHNEGDAKKEPDSSPSPSPRSTNSAAPPTATATATPPDDTKKGLSRQRGSLSESSGSRGSVSVTERPNSSTVILPRKMGVEEGKALAVDSGAVGYAAVDVKTGRAMDAALKQLVLAIRKDRQLRAHHNHMGT